ncbi:MAG: hydrogenase maturation protease [Candidatus Omnitrophota bacterium]|nr:hydrogenase maturation protease [Candidatus Omnitrophota bacterium]
MLNSSKRFAVIGLGNTLRKDDGIGIIVLESLLKSLKHPQIDYLNFGIASFDVVHRMEKYELILLIDGIDGSTALTTGAGLKPGELKIFELKDISYHLKGPALSTHEFDLKSLFELYKRFELKSKIYVAGIQVKDVSYGEGLSPELKMHLDQILQGISRYINKVLSASQESPQE